MQKDIFIVHRHPIELYPPIQNLINFLIDNEINVTVCSSYTNKGSVFSSSKAKIYRLTGYNFKKSLFIRIIELGKFVLYCLILLIIKKPKKILYFDSHSSYPVYLYKTYIQKKTDILIHYHEYMSQEEYLQKGMKLINYFHTKEHRLYTKALWISHTNEQRIAFFLDDHPHINKTITKILPNYPPKSWATKKPKVDIAFPVRFVYIGSFASFETIYIQEFLTWVLLQKGSITLDIYSSFIPDGILTYIKKLNCAFIKVKGFIDYCNIPYTLINYDIGVILYKGHSKNVIYCASNKLFEYLACGLDVWFPEEIVGTQSFCTKYTYPKVVSIDFKNLIAVSYRETISHEGLFYKPSNWFCEPIYSELINHVKNAEG